MKETAWMPTKTRYLRLLMYVPVLLFLGLIYAWSVFIAPLEAEFGWLRTDTSVTFTVSMCCFCLDSVMGAFFPDAKALGRVDRPHPAPQGQAPRLTIKKQNLLLRRALPRRARLLRTSVLLQTLYPKTPRLTTVIPKIPTKNILSRPTTPSKPASAHG